MLKISVKIKNNLLTCQNFLSTRDVAKTLSNPAKIFKRSI